MNPFKVGGAGVAEGAAVVGADAMTPGLIFHWIAIPRGIIKGVFSNDKGRLNVYVMPQLGPMPPKPGLPPPTGLLQDYPDLLNWPQTLSQLRFSVRFSRGRAADGLTPTITPPPEKLRDFYTRQFYPALPVATDSSSMAAAMARVSARSTMRQTFNPMEIHARLSEDHVNVILGKYQGFPKLNEPGEEFTFLHWRYELLTNPKIQPSPRPDPSTVKKYAEAFLTFQSIFSGNTRYPLALRFLGFLFELDVPLIDFGAGTVQIVPDWAQLPNAKPASAYAADICPRTIITNSFTVDPRLTENGAKVDRHTASGRSIMKASDYVLTQFDLVADYSKAIERNRRFKAQHALRGQFDPKVDVSRPHNAGLALLFGGFRKHFKDADERREAYNNYVFAKVTELNLPDYQLVLFDDEMGTVVAAHDILSLQRGWAVRASCDLHDNGEWKKLCNRATLVALEERASNGAFTRREELLGLDEGWLSNGSMTQPGGTYALHFPAIMEWRMRGLLVPPDASSGPDIEGNPDKSAGLTGQGMPEVAPATFMPRSAILGADNRVVKDQFGTPMRIGTMPQRFGYCYHISLSRMLLDGDCVYGNAPDLENSDPQAVGMVSNLVTTFYRYEPIDPPAVWAQASFPVGTSTDTPPGESTDYLVVRDGDGSCIRYLYAPPVNALLAERHGVFDDPTPAIGYFQLRTRECLALPPSSQNQLPLATVPYLPDPFADGVQLISVVEIRDLTVDVDSGPNIVHFPSYTPAEYKLSPNWPDVGPVIFSLLAGLEGGSLAWTSDSVNSSTRN